MNEIDDVFWMNETMDAVVFDIGHEIIGFNAGDIHKEMMLKFQEIADADNGGFSDYDESVDLYKYEIENLRPFYFTTNTWTEGSCDGTLVNGLSMLDFERFCEKVAYGHAIYAYSGSGHKLPQGMDRVWYKWIKYGDNFKANDTISVILDLRKGQISYLKNGVDQGIAYENIQRDDKIQYQLLVSLQGMGDCVEITNFTMY